VYDLDSRLQFPCSFSVYASETLRDDSILKSFLRRFVQLSSFYFLRPHPPPVGGSRGIMFSGCPSRSPSVGA